MTKPSARAIAAAALPWLKEAMQLQQWDITVKCEPIKDAPDSDNEASAQILVNAEYRTAAMCLDYTRIADDKEALRCIRHELLHVAHSDFDNYKDLVASTVAPVCESIMAKAFSQAEERTVANLERMLDGLGMTPEAMIRKAKARKT